ncbi:hypothetical protein BZA05DRAFT_392834 [Tricharina praecox]|uniref:uncharacterized protein n=1 Tax=Tricharina praecox TaxID=43433 RepID=UPI00221F7549|nr:uncharacterized protein BZA05DRAFT_392834 [Tricharina praecox]KAI5854872.1 hypothetical protein BZA05DRAFT_392834 [Tricharina praecox]
MFDEPETKRIRRADLDDSDTEVNPPTVPTEALYLDLEYITSTSHKEAVATESVDEDLELDFSLFSGAAPQRLKLRSPTPPPAEEDVWDAVAHSRKRPLGHWLITPSELEERRKKVAMSVVSGIDILKDAKKQWPAKAVKVEWKVTHISTADVPETEMKEGRRKRPGKKKRIKTRIAKKAELEKEERRRKSQADRNKFVGMTPEERAKAEDEERIRKNREKALKRRAREKAKKAAAAATTAAG